MFFFCNETNTSLDFFLCGYLRESVYIDNLATIPELKNNIRRAITKIKYDVSILRHCISQVTAKSELNTDSDKIWTISMWSILS